MVVEAPNTRGLAHAVFLSRVGELPATSPEVRLGQGAFLALRLVDLLAPDREPVQPDVFRYQLAATDRYCSELAQEGIEAAHLNGVVRSAGEAFRRKDAGLVIPALFAYVYHLENSLHLEEALDVVETLLRVGGRNLVQKDAIAAHLRLGLLHRNLARFDEADTAYRNAQQLAEASGDGHSILLSRVGRAFSLMRRGNLATAEQDLKGILADAQGASDLDAQARAEHVLGDVLYKRGQAHEAAPHLWRAFGLYEESAAQVRALSDLGLVMRALGDIPGAERALHEVVRRGGENNANATLNAQIELMYCASSRNDRVGFERFRARCERSLDSMLPNMMVDFRLKEGIAQARFGNFRKARQLLDVAQSEASAHRLHEFEFRIDRIKAGLGDCEEVAREGLHATAEPVLQTEALREVSASLALLGA